MAGLLLDGQRVKASARKDSHTRPRIAGMHDIMLGASSSATADAEAVGELLRLIPDAVVAAYQSLSFVRRAVRFAAGPGKIRQFINIRSGLSTALNIYQIVQCLAPGARLLQLDGIVSASYPPLARSDQATTIDGDCRDVRETLSGSELHGKINLDEPVAIILCGVLHFVENDHDAQQLVGALTRSLATGSQVVISHATGDDLPPDIVRNVRGLYQNARAPLTLRTRQQIAEFLDDLDVIPPGVVRGSAWRPGYAAAEPRRALFYAAMARKTKRPL